MSFRWSSWTAIVGNVFDFPGSDCVVHCACIFGGQVGQRKSEMCLIFRVRTVLFVVHEF